MDRNALLAIVLSVIVLVGWFYFFPQPNPQVEKPIEERSEVTAEAESQSALTDNNTEITQVISVEDTDLDDSTLVEETFSVTTDNYSVQLTNYGAKITSLLYGDRKIELVAPNELTDGMMTNSFYFTDSEFLKNSGLDKTLWHVTEKNNNSYVFSKYISINGNNILVNKIYEFPKDSYFYNLKFQFSNKSGEAIALPAGKIIFSSNDFVGPKMKDLNNRYNTMKQLYYTSKKKNISKGGGFNWFGLTNNTPSDIKYVAEQGEWAGVLSRYFAVILVSDGSKSDGIIADTRKDTSYKTGLVYNLPILNSEEKKQFDFKVAVSEKKKNVLSTVQPNLEAASDTNQFIDPIRVAVLWSLNSIRSFIPNLGWTIILFSIVTKLIFLPLTQKSTESMKKMSQLQPEIQKIKEKFPEDQQKQQEATMKLYKERGVNPMGGCLPMLIQMPFFIALYSALINSVELWNTPFIFWINDLSLPDTAFTVFNFDIHILPLIMTITSFFQQKVSTVDTGGGSQQQMMMKMMPVILLFIFWSMPSGLILYWTVQNILQVGHQLFVNRKKA
jgi:YidC/Oxa1 family membrane protein insertase